MNEEIQRRFSPKWSEPPVGEDESLRIVREEIRAIHEETWRLMLVLHEEVMEHLKALEGKL